LVNAIPGRAFIFSTAFQLNPDRELRDRWLEQTNEDPSLVTSQAKYDVERRDIAQALLPEPEPAQPQAA
jgi:hypothetical protein